MHGKGDTHGKHRLTITATSGSAARLPRGADEGAGNTITITVNPAKLYPKYTTEDAGIRAGEIIAYRAWRIDGPLLYSFMTFHEWKPHAMERCDRGTMLATYWGYGLHAYKDIEGAYIDFAGLQNIVFGEVALWGTVIEHERGYRAEFAKIVKLYECSEEYGPIRRLIHGKRIDRLRKIYGV